jgi:hypothetical protein
MAIFVHGARRIVGGSRHVGSTPTCHGATASAAIIDIEGWMVMAIVRRI